MHIYTGMTLPIEIPMKSDRPFEKASNFRKKNGENVYCLHFINQSSTFIHYLCFENRMETEDGVKFTFYLFWLENKKSTKVKWSGRENA